MEDVLIALEDELRRKTLSELTFLAKNFRGLSGDYNPTGRRQFLIVISDEQAKDLTDASWPVKRVVNKKDVPVYFIRVSFPDGFDVSKIKLNGEAITSEDELSALDHQEVFIGSIDLYGSPWHFCPMHGRPERFGINPYIVGMDVRTKS